MRSCRNATRIDVEHRHTWVSVDNPTKCAWMLTGKGSKESRRQKSIVLVYGNPSMTKEMYFRVDARVHRGLAEDTCRT